MPIFIINSYYFIFILSTTSALVDIKILAARPIMIRITYRLMNGVS